MDNTTTMISKENEDQIWKYWIIVAVRIQRKKTSNLKILTSWCCRKYIRRNKQSRNYEEFQYQNTEKKKRRRSFT